MSLRFKVYLSSSKGKIIAACQEGSDALAVVKNHSGERAGASIKYAGVVVWNSRGDSVPLVETDLKLLYQRCTGVDRRHYDKVYGEGAYDRFMSRFTTPTKEASS